MKLFEEFIVDIDKDGKNIIKSCNYHNLEPITYLKPVFFRKQVLQKYYDNPQKYKVVISIWYIIDSSNTNHRKTFSLLMSGLVLGMLAGWTTCLPLFL